MNKYLLYIFGIFTVLTLAIIILEEQEEPTKQVSIEQVEIKIFQIGAFKDIKSATNLKEKENSILIKTNDYYYVYKSILIKEENISKMINYLNDKNVYYYIKNDYIDSNKLKKIEEYENLMKDTTSELAFITINNKILKEYEGIYEN